MARKKVKQYEAEKARIQQLNLPPKEYERQIRQLAIKLKI